MTNYEQYQPQERPGYYQPQQQGYYQPQQYMPPVVRQGRGLAVAAFVCSLVELAFVLLAFVFFGAAMSGIGGALLIMAFVLVVATPLLLLLLISKR